MCVSSRILLTHPSAVVEVVISYAMGTSDNTHVSNLKCCHYLMCFFCVSLYCFFLFFSFFLNYLMGCHRRISRRGPDRLRPNEMNLFAPNLRRRAAHLGGTVLRLLDNKYIFLRGWSFSILKLWVRSLILNLWFPQNEKRKKKVSKNKNRSTAVLL